MSTVLSIHDVVTTKWRDSFFSVTEKHTGGGFKLLRFRAAISWVDSFTLKFVDDEDRPSVRRIDGDVEISIVTQDEKGDLKRWKTVEHTFRVLSGEAGTFFLTHYTLEEEDEDE